MIEKIVFMDGARDGEIVENNGSKDRVPDIIDGTTLMYIPGDAYILIGIDYDKGHAMYEPLTQWRIDALTDEVGD